MWVPEAGVLHGVGHELLVDEVVRIVVGILIAVAVAEVLHHLCGGVAQVHGHLQLPGGGGGGTVSAASAAGQNAEAQAAGEPLPYNPDELHTKHQTWRNRINEIEDEVAELEAMEPDVEEPHNVVDEQ